MQEHKEVQNEFIFKIAALVQLCIIYSNDLGPKELGIQNKIMIYLHSLGRINYCISYACNHQLFLLLIDTLDMLCKLGHHLFGLLFLLELLLRFN